MPLIKAFPQDPDSKHNVQYILYDDVTKLINPFNETWLNYTVNVEIVDVQVEFQNPVVFNDLVVGLEFGRRFRDFEVNQPSGVNRVLVLLQKMHGSDTITYKCYPHWNRPMLEYVDTIEKRRNNELQIDVNNLRGTNPITGFRVLLRVTFVDI